MTKINKKKFSKKEFDVAQILLTLNKKRKLIIYIRKKK